MKIVIVMPLGVQKGGGELSLYHLMHQGRDLGVEWFVVFFEDGPLVTAIQQLGIRTCVMSTGRLRQVHLYCRAVLRLAALLRTERPTAVMGWMGHAELYAGPAGFLSGTPSLWYQVASPSADNVLDRIATCICTLGVITNSRSGQAVQQSLWPHKPAALVYHGAELHRFDPESLPTPAECRRELGLPAEGPIVGLVGRLQRWKGIHTLLRAMPAIIEQHPDATCVVVGGEHHLEPDYSLLLESIICDLGIQKSVVMAGHQANVHLWMQAMDVVVHASDREPFGIVIVEGMALGKPVVAGSLGGPTEIITPEVNGLLAAFDGPAQLCAAVLRYLDDPAFGERIGRAAKERAKDFSDRTFAVNMVDVIARLANVDLSGGGVSQRTELGSRVAVGGAQS